MQTYVYMHLCVLAVNARFVYLSLEVAYTDNVQNTACIITRAFC